MATIEDLDAQIAAMKTRLSDLKADRDNLATILLSQPRLAQCIEQRPGRRDSRSRAVTQRADLQRKRNLENVYRGCAGVTAYKVKDPDPYAVDGGNMLGMRIDVSIGNNFVETYHVLFNRPDSKHKNVLKIHKHTIPPCIPLQQLAQKWMSQRFKATEVPAAQNIVKLGRALRTELVSWHMRKAAVEKLRSESGMEAVDRRAREKDAVFPIEVVNAFVSDDEDADDEEDTHADGSIRMIEFEADAASRNLSIRWTNGQVLGLRLSKDGQIDKAVAKDKEGIRDHVLARKALGRIEGLLDRLN